MYYKGTMNVARIYGCLHHQTSSPHCLIDLSQHHTRSTTTKSLAPTMALTTAAITLLLAANAALAAPIESVVERRGNLPTPIAVSTARTYLSQLKVEVESNSPAYDRDLFNHWITISGTCNARETVLKRDGTNVVTSSACASTSGSWYSDYDGLTFTVSSEVDIDHLVPLVRYHCCSHCYIAMSCIITVIIPAD